MNRKEKQYGEYAKNQQYYIIIDFRGIIYVYVDIKSVISRLGVANHCHFNIWVQSLSMEIFNMFWQNFDNRGHVFEKVDSRDIHLRISCFSALCHFNNLCEISNFLLWLITITINSKLYDYLCEQISCQYISNKQWKAK